MNTDDDVDHMLRFTMSKRKSKSKRGFVQRFVARRTSKALRYGRV